MNIVTTVNCFAKMKIIHFILILFFATLSPSLYAQDVKNINKWIVKGERAEKKGDVEKAIHYYELTIKAYNECDSTDNKLGDVLSSLASLYSDLGDKLKAIEYEDQALEVRRIVFGENTRITPLH